MKHAEGKNKKDASQHESHKGKYKYSDDKHSPWKCPAYGRKCAKCNNLNHFAKVSLLNTVWVQNQKLGSKTSS